MPSALTLNFRSPSFGGVALGWPQLRVLHRQRKHEPHALAMELDSSWACLVYDNIVRTCSATTNKLVVITLTLATTTFTLSMRTSGRSHVVAGSAHLIQLLCTTSKKSIWRA